MTFVPFTRTLIPHAEGHPHGITPNSPMSAMIIVAELGERQEYTLVRSAVHHRMQARVFNQKRSSYW